MPPKVALLGTVLVVLWLFAWERRRFGRMSPALWLPTLWMVIIASRPVSSWFGSATDTFQEESSLDRQCYLALIVAALFVLARRRVDWKGLAGLNIWLLVYLGYWGLSVLWAEDPFVCFKRWVKDLGSALMVLLILSDANPLSAVRVVFGRVGFLLIPTSALLIKYYPDLGMSYDTWVGEQRVVGAALSKNSLGVLVAVSAIMIIWELVVLLKSRDRPASKVDLYTNAALLLIGLWLLKISNSATSLLCTILATCVFVAFTVPAVQRSADRFLSYGIGAGVVAMVALLVFDLPGLILGLLGRDATLTGRTEIWSMVLNEKINPLVGTGFYSFWSNERVMRFSDHHSLLVNQAHNGYLETYLNGGAVAVVLLLVLVVAGGKIVSRSLAQDPRMGGLRFVFFAVPLIHNVTEATFSRLSPIWIMFLMAVIAYPRRFRSAIRGHGVRKQPGRSFVAQEGPIAAA